MRLTNGCYKDIYCMCFFILLLINEAFTSFIFASTLGMWRQIIWVVSLLLFIKYNYGKISSLLSNITKVHLSIFLYFIVLSVVTLYSYGFNYIRLFYAFWIYFSGLPFLILPFIVSYSKFSNSKFISFLAYSGLFFACGLVLDYLLGGIITITLNQTYDKEFLEENARYCFTSQEPTTFSIIYDLQLLCVIWKLHIERIFIKKIYLIVIIIIYLTGAWFTGSRQLLLILLITVGIVLFYEFFFISKGKSLFTIGLIVILFSLPLLKNLLFHNDFYGNRYDVKELKYDQRSQLWKKGFDTTVANPLIFLMGKGVGYSQGQKALQNEEVGSHFENSYYARLSEVGIVGLYLLLFPVIYIVKRFSIKKFPDVLLCSLMLSYLIICYISPNGASTTSQIAVYLALGLFICRKEFFKENYE